MGKFFSACTVLLTGIMFSSAAGADSGSAFFGVGITVLKSAPIAPPGIIYRNAVYTPGAVSIGLAAEGYKQINLVSRDADGYVFSAISRRDGQHYLVTVAAWRGEIISAERD
ncbi:MAG: hypothetical protein ABI230_09340 [Aestuariivirga sp.]